MTHARSRAGAAAGLGLLAVVIAACSPSKPAETTSTPTTANPVAIPNTAPLLGDMKPIASVKELMQYMIDPASDYIFDSVKTLVRPDGKTVEVEPKTDEDW